MTTPIIPGPAEPQASPDPPLPIDRPAAPKHRRWIPIAIGVCVLVVLAGGITIGAVLNSSNTSIATKPTPTKVRTQLRLAHEHCSGVGEMSDGDRTMFLDMEGEDLDSGDLDVGDLACILDALDTPSYVIRTMDQTRALDGRQTETWDGFEASWTYHPDDGLDVLIREV